MKKEKEKLTVGEIAERLFDDVKNSEEQFYFSEFNLEHFQKYCELPDKSEIKAAIIQANNDLSEGGYPGFIKYCVQNQDGSHWFEYVVEEEL